MKKPDTKVCARCEETKPIKQFRRLLTRAETRAHGKLGRFRMEVESKNCATCRSELRKPLSKRSIKELHNMSVSGDLRTYIAEARIAKRRSDNQAMRVQNVRRSWENRVKLMWSYYLEHLNAELRRAREAHRYQARKRNGVSEVSDAVLGFYTTYCQTVAALRSTLQLAARTKKMPHKLEGVGTMPAHLTRMNPQLAMVDIEAAYRPDAPNWPRFLTPAQRNELWTAWTELDADQRTRMADPIAVTWREPVHNTGSN